jgi:hypothetical protein
MQNDALDNTRKQVDAIMDAIMRPRTDVERREALQTDWYGGITGENDKLEDEPHPADAAQEAFIAAVDDAKDSDAYYEAQEKACIECEQEPCGNPYICSK